MIAGQKCRVTFNGKTVDAVVHMGSNNRYSLMLTFDAALYTSAGDMYPGTLFVMRTDDGVYRDSPACMEQLVCAVIVDRHRPRTAFVLQEAECSENLSPSRTSAEARPRAPLSGR